MQTANIVLHLGGDSGTTVPKYGVTISEIAVLQMIHGAGSVSEIEPGEDIQRSGREDLARLREIYGRAKTQTPEGDVLVMNVLFPGAAARALESFDDLDIDESFFKATERAKPAAPKPTKRGKKADADASDEKADEPVEEKPEDDVSFDDDQPSGDQQSDDEKSKNLFG